MTHDMQRHIENVPAEDTGVEKDASSHSEQGQLFGDVHS